MTSKKNNNARKIRAALIRKGLTLRQWAAKNNFNLSTVYRSVRGERSGPVSEEILNELKKTK